MSSNDELETLVREFFVNKRVCPAPKKWNDLFSLISRKAGTQDLSAPLILGGWWASNNLEKKIRFKSHIEFAYNNGVIEEVKEFLSKLDETEWHHLDD